MRIKEILGFCLILTLLIGCSQTNVNEKNKNVKLTKLNNQSELNFDLSEEVKNNLINDPDIKTIHGANIDNTLVLALEIPQMSRFETNSIEKKVKQNIKEDFHNVDVHLSTDKKISMELEKLEEKIAQSSVSKDDVKKELKRIIKLMNEET